MSGSTSNDELKKIWLNFWKCVNLWPCWRNSLRLFYNMFYSDLKITHRIDQKSNIFPVLSYDQSFLLETFVEWRKFLVVLRNIETKAALKWIAYWWRQKNTSNAENQICGRRDVSISWEEKLNRRNWKMNLDLNTSEDTLLSKIWYCLTDK